LTRTRIGRILTIVRDVTATQKSMLSRTAVRVDIHYDPLALRAVGVFDDMASP